MTVKIEKYSAFRAVGLIWSGKMENAPNFIPQFWENDFLPRVHEIKDANQELWGGANSYGIMWNFDMDNGTMEYLAGVEVKEARIIPEKMVMWEIPSNIYAVARGPLSKLHDVINEIYQNWLPNSEYLRLQGAPEFELYGKEFYQDNRLGLIGYYIPIEKIK